MAAAAHRNQEIVRTRKCHGIANVGRHGTARNQSRTPVKHAIPYLARIFIADIARQQDLSTHAVAKLLDRGFFKNCFPAPTGHSRHVIHDFTHRLARFGEDLVHRH